MTTWMMTNDEKEDVDDIDDEDLDDDDVNSEDVDDEYGDMWCRICGACRLGR